MRRGRAQILVFFFFQAEDGIRDYKVTGVQTCALPISFLDTLGVERAGLINYVAPRIIGFTPEVNDWSAQYCSAAPDRLIAFGGVLPEIGRASCRERV